MSKDEQKYLGRTLVIGPGGHGSACIDRHITDNPKILFDYIMMTCDDGGCTGRINQHFNKSIDSIPKEFLQNLKPEKPAIALGDLKNNILVWTLKTIESSFAKKGYSKAQIENIQTGFKAIFEFRTDKNNFEANLYQLKACFNDLCGYYPSLSKFRGEFLQVCDYYLKQVDFEPTSFGNLLLQLIYNTSENSNEFFKELKEIGFVPKNVNLHFLLEKQMILEGKIKQDGVEETVVSEAAIDEAKSPILLESYLLRDSKGNQIDLEYLLQHNPDLIDLIRSYKQEGKTQNQVLFPAGSIANLIPVLNILGDELRKTGVLITWISNAFRTLNEATIEDLIDFMYSKFKSVAFAMLGNAHHPFSYCSQELQDAYEAEGKVAVSPEEVANHILIKRINNSFFYLPILEMNDESGPGVKYPTEFLDRIIQTINKEWGKSIGLGDFKTRMIVLTPIKIKETIYSIELKITDKMTKQLSVAFHPKIKVR
jgi:hypothetical protein